MIKSKYIYPLAFFFFIFSIFINPLFLKLFTVDKEINLKNLKIFLYFLSFLSLFTFCFFLINFNKLNRSSLFILVAFYVSLIFCISLIEIFGNIISSKKNSNKIVKVKGYEIEATYVYNNQGFRDKNFKNDQYEKIFLIGDSFVFGAGVDEQYTLDKLIEKKIINKKLEVFNLGVSGSSPYEYLEVLKKFEKFNVSRIIMVLYLDNDVGSVFFSNVISKTDKLLSKSKLITLIRDNFLEEDIFTTRFIEKFNLNEKYKKIFLDQSANPHILAINHRGELHNHYENLSEIFKKNTSLKNIILESKKISDNKGAKFTVVLVPWKYQVKKKYINFAEKNLGYNFKYKDVINNNLQKNILTWCLRNSIDCLDLTKYLKNSKKNNYYDLDDHFNSNGNELAAEIIFKHINQTKK